MKICPKCHTRYTDVTLTYCLQDGAALETASGHKTEVFDAESFGNQDTVAVTPRGTDPSRTKSGDEVSLEDASVETVVRESKGGTAAGSRLGFLTGLVVGAIVLLVFAAVTVGFWFLPQILQDKGNSNTAVDDPKTIEITAEAIEAVTASSVRKAEKGNLYIPENTIDDDVRTAWCEGVKGTGRGEWIKVEFSETLQLAYINLKPGYFKNASLWKKNNRVASVQLQFSNGQYRIFDLADKMKTQRISLEGIETKFVKITVKNIFRGSADVEDTLISELDFAAIR